MTTISFRKSQHKSGCLQLALPVVMICMLLPVSVSISSEMNSEATVFTPGHVSAVPIGSSNNTPSQRILSGTAYRKLLAESSQTTYSGVDDADHAPTLPDSLIHENEKIDEISQDLDRGLKNSDRDKLTLDKKMKELQDVITDDLSDVTQDVRDDNKELTDEVAAVPETVGPPGVPGGFGPPGLQGLPGTNGEMGLQGPPGRKGLIGVVGPPGVQGPTGPRGQAGKEGKLGKSGIQGGTGVEGPIGEDGKTRSWSKDQYFCPKGITDSMRLMDCSTHGCRLEVLFEDEWGTICSGGMNAAAGDVLCKDLGFPMGGSVVPRHGGGQGIIWLDGVTCIGDEGDVGDCKHGPWGKVDCKHGDDVGLCCYGGHPDGPVGKRIGPSSFPRCPAITTADMRLVDCNREVCRLEINHNNTWGTVCDNGFTDTNAVTICKLMGFPNGKFKEMCATQGPWGSCKENKEGSGPIWLDDVVCLGFERDLEGCRHRPWGEHRCTHKQDVGICCSGTRGDFQTPGKCRHGELDYKFNENLESSTGGPDLAAPWGGTFDGVQGYRFTEGQGLGVDPSGCIGPNSYTVYLDLELDQTDRERKLLHSNGWEEAGLYIKSNKLLILPENEKLVCDQVINPQEFNQIVMTRDPNGLIRLFINGALCGEDTSSDKDFLAINPDDMMFLADYGLKNPSGHIKRIRAFAKALSEDEVAKISNCRLTERDKPCNRHIEMNAALPGIAFSSVKAETWTQCGVENELCICAGKVRYGAQGIYKILQSSSSISCSNDVFGDPLPGIRKMCECLPKFQMGAGYASGRMNSPQAWSAGVLDTNQWMQMDTGSVQSMAGVITQGRRDTDEWVTSFSVQVSGDGKDWISVGCGRIWPANKDRNSKVRSWFHEPVKARYIRILPITWAAYISMRAGVIVCERPCIDGELNYMFPMSFISSTQGPPLEATWGEGEFEDVELNNRAVTVYEFDEGEGLQLAQQRCLKGSLTWTILVDVKLDSVDGYKRILGSEGWGDYGLYVNQRLMIVPRSAHMICQEKIRTTKFYKFVMTRDEKGQVKVYINGALCASGSPSYKDHFQLNPDNIMILRDDANENAGGLIKNVHIWDKALVEKDVESVCECTLPDTGDACTYTVVFNPPSARTSYSSVWNQDQVGKGHASGRLGSKQGWSAVRASVEEYMQIDTGFVQSVSGIVTQGRHDADEWVESYSVQVSVDGAAWMDVGCGTEFDANSDRSTKVKNYFKAPVKARYVRIYPQSWHNWISMRAGLLLCEKPCKDAHLEYDFSGVFASKTDGPSLDPAWGDGDFDDKLGYGFLQGEGLELDASRCLQNPDAWTMVIYVRLDSVNGYHAIMTSEKWGDGYGLYVDKYLQLAPIGANLICEEKVIQPNQFYYFAITRSSEGRITLYLNGAKCASSMELFKDHYHLDTSQITFLRDDSDQDSGGYVKNILLWGKLLDKYEVASNCDCLLPQAAMSACDQLVEYTAIAKKSKYSSVLQNSPTGTGYARGRLNSRGGWQPATSTVGEWMEMDTGRIQSIAGVVTQGSKDQSAWVTSYFVKVSDDGYEWKDVRCRWELNANTDQNGKVRNKFQESVLGRFVRIYPTTWYGTIAMRAGVLLCMNPCSNGELYYELGKESLLSSTDGPGLETPWGSGYFTGDGYRFIAGQGFNLDENEELCMNDHKNLTANDTNTAYTISMTVQFDETSSWVRLISSSGWGDDGVYINKKYQLFPPGANMKCAETIRAGIWYQFGITRTRAGVLALYINGGKCSKGRPGFSRGLTLDPHDITFFHDDGDENAAGEVKEIHLWDRALSEEEMADYAGCQLNDVAPRCARTIAFSPTYLNTKYSSVLDGSVPGVGLGRVRLNSPQAWIPESRPGEEEYVQFDIGEVQSIAGVVTQGRRDDDQWVTAFSVLISSDEVTWVPVFCGQVFDANVDRNTKAKVVFRRPVLARFIRIIPETWYGRPAMRAGVLICEHKCIAGTLDYKLQTSFLSATDGPALNPAWGEGSFDNPDAGYRFAVGQGFTLDESVCIPNPENITILMDVTLDVTSGYQNLIGSDGWGNYGFYVNQQFQAYPSAAQLKCSESIIPGVSYKYIYSRSSDGAVQLYLNGYLCAQGFPPFVEGYLPDPTSLIFLHSDDGWNSAGYVKKIKIWNRVLSKTEAAHESECFLAEVGASCNSTVILVPSYSRVRYSSSWGGYPMGSFCAQGKLGSDDGWCASSPQIGEYIQIDTGIVQSIQGVVTQGRASYWQWVASYKVSVSVDGLHFSQVQCGRVFDANTDMQTQVQNIFDAPVIGRFVRIIPQTWYNWMSMRAAVLICEQPCKTGQLDYQLLDDFLSTTDGPNLNAPWGYNQFDPNLGYRFWGGRGLQLDESTCMNGQGAWTILIETSLDQTQGAQQRLLGSEGWGSAGIFVANRKFGVSPGADVQCKQLLLPNVFYRFVITRSVWGDVSLFVNGYKCASGNPPYASGLQLNAHDVDFFHDKGNNNGQGYVKHIEMWSKVLSDTNAATVSGCTLLPPANTACNSSFPYSPPDTAYKFSSIYSNDPVGVGYGRGRLNSPQAWSVGWPNTAEYMQIDVGQLTSIAGIVTQGRQEAAQWVTLVQVTFSTDGKRWYQVQCGETFAANVDMTTKVYIQFDFPIEARFVRIWPIEWYNWISMRAGVLMCEMQCKGGVLDYRFKDTLVSSTLGPALLPQWGEGYFDTSSGRLGYRFGVGQGFDLNAVNCISGNDYTMIMEARFDDTSKWIRLLTSGPWGDFGLYIREQTFMLYPRSIGMSCQGAILPGFFYKFGLSRTLDGRVTLYLNGYPCVTKSPSLVSHFALDTSDMTFLHDEGNDNGAGFVRRIRLWSQDFSDDDIASINECVPAEETDPCDRTVVYNAPYSNIQYSSVYADDAVGYRYGSGRLDSNQGWSAGNWRVGEYMQIDTGLVQKIAGIVTQMRSDWAWQFVTAYSVAVSEDGDSWFDVQCGTTFNGNNPNGWNDKEVKVFTHFKKPVKGRYVQIIVQSWVGYPSMRAAVLICEIPCSDGMLDYPLAGDMMSTTNGPALEPIGGGGDFTSDGYRYNWGQGLMVDQKSCVSDPSSYSIIVKARLDNTDTWNRLVYSNGWGRYGLFVQGGVFEFFPVDLGLVCSGLIQPNTVYQFGITHTSDAEVKLYLNGWMCATGLVFDAPNQLNLAPDDLEFFKDPNNLNYYGYVSRVRVWNKVLTEAEMMSAMNCRLPEDAKQTCTSYVQKNVPYSQMRFDAVYGNYAAGQYYGRGRLNDNYGWLSPDYSQGHWIQLDLGQVLSVAGVVTQGMSWGWFTTSFYVRVSKDGRKWASVECGRTFQGNTDWWNQVQTLFTATVLAQYVRIYPQTFIGYANMRAGAVVCESPCQNGKLDYNFQETFESSTDGPSLTIPWGQGSFDPNSGYNFNAGQGLQIPNRATCIETATAYSLIINVRLAYAWWASGPLSQNYFSLFTSQDWGDAGLYVNSVLSLKPPSISCAEVVRAQYYYQFGMTRGADGTVTLYMNGYPCASGTPPYKKGYSLAADMVFFNGINSQNSPGYVKEIRVWDTALSAADMATLSGCDLNTEKDSCNGLVVLNIAYTDMTASTVWGGGTIVGSFWGQAQLDSIAAWIPNDWTVGKMWLQLDTGKSQTIAGLITQGNGYYGYYNWFLTSFWVQISDDGASWNYVECGRIYVGNTDWNTKVKTMFAKPVKARYIRILPETYNGYPSLRAGVLVCESDCSNQELHYDLVNGFSSTTGGPSLKVPWGQGTFDNQHYNFGAGQGLEVNEKSCLTSGDQYSILIMANLQSVNNWAALFSSTTWGDSGLFVNLKYQLKGGALVCKNEPIRSGFWYQYGMVHSKTGTIDLYLNGYKCASGSPSLNGGFKLPLDDMTFFHGINGQSPAGSVSNIHVWGKALSESDMMSESGCTLPNVGTDRCSSQVVLKIPYSQITASTVYAGYSISRGSYYGQPYLNSPTSWLAYNWDQNQWLQFDAGDVMLIAGVVTQGSANWYAWTTLYKVMVSADGSTWNYVECGRIFDANSDMNTKVQNVFDFPVKAQFVRICPIGWYNYVTMRAALLVCETKCDGDMLDYQFDETFTSSTDGPSLVGEWGEGQFGSQQIRSSTNVYTTNEIYSFSSGQGLWVNPKSCLTSTDTYSVLIFGWVSRNSGFGPLMTASAWQDNGLFINTNFVLKGTTLQCQENIRDYYYYQYGITRDSDGTVTLYLNGYPCASGSPSESSGFALDNKGLTFFRSQNGNENSWGWVQRIRLWSTALSASDMAQYSGCSLPEAGSVCSGLIELNVPYSQITASSIWYGYGISQGWGQVQLDSQGSWAPGRWSQGEWLQLDTGSVQMIAGVVTQGSGNYWGYWAYYVTSIWVQVSKDGVSWTYVECGRIFDTFTGAQYYQAYYSKVRSTFAQPVKARYVRIMIENWINGPMMRAGVLVCEPECSNGELQYDMTNTLASTTGGPSLTSPWGNGDFQNIGASWWQPVSGIVYNFYTNRGGLQVQQSACIKSTQEYTILLHAQISNINNAQWQAIFTTTGWNNDGLYLHQYFQLKPTKLSCGNEPILPGYYYWYGMTRTKKGVIALYLNGYRCGSDIPDQHNGYTLPQNDMMFFHGATTDQTPQGTIENMQIYNSVLSDADIQTVTGCSLPAEGTTQCTNYVVLNPPIQYYSASTIASYGTLYDHYYCASPRLDTRYSWCPANTWQQSFLQIDTGEVQTITGVITQGYMYGSYWVTIFKVRVSKDGADWRDVECGRIFQGNTDYNTKLRTAFAQQVEARYVQILPMGWNNYPMLRAAVMVCEKDCVDGHLDYEMRDFRSSTGGPDIDAPWGQGDFVPFETDDNHDYPYSDIQYYPSMSFDDCAKACEADERCGLVGLYKAQGSGCWLKYDYGTIQGRGRTPDSSRKILFHIDSLIYRLLAPVGYQFDGGEGMRLNAATCMTSSSDYSIYIDAMLKNVGNGLKRILTSKGWGDKGVYLNNQMIGLFPSASGLHCAQNILPFYNFKFGMTRTSSGQIKLYVNGMLCASGFPKYANGYLLNLEDISFFYDSDAGYQEQGWIRRIQLWDSPLSDSEMASASNCTYTVPLSPCQNGTSLFAATASDIDFSSTLNRDDFGTGYAQGYRVLSTGFANTQDMRNAGQQPPPCAPSSLGVTVQTSPNSKNYFLTTGGTFDQVRATCIKNGGDLATINSVTDVQAVSNVCRNWCYIGLQRDTPTSPWRWLDNTTVGFTSWQNGQPDQPQNGETKVAAWYGGNWNDWGSGGAWFSGVCETGANGWNNLTGENVVGTARLTPGSYGSLNNEGYCDNSAKMCTISKCTFALSQMQSMQVPDGLTVILYDQSWFQGNSKKYVGPANINNLQVDGWSNRAQSMKILVTGQDEEISSNEVGFWTPQYLPNQAWVWPIGEWMQVDLREKQNISHVVTSGFGGYYRAPASIQGSVPGWYYNWQVTLFLLRISDDAENWRDVECGRLFQTPWLNTPNAPVVSNFSAPVQARFIRLYPLAWQNAIALKMQVGICS